MLLDNHINIKRALLLRNNRMDKYLREASLVKNYRKIEGLHIALQIDRVSEIGRGSTKKAFQVVPDYLRGFYEIGDWLHDNAPGQWGYTVVTGDSETVGKIDYCFENDTAAVMFKMMFVG